MAKWGIWFFVIGRRTLTPDLGENGVKTLVCVNLNCVWLIRVFNTVLSNIRHTIIDSFKTY
jgi:hypothetical protein